MIQKEYIAASAPRKLTVCLLMQSPDLGGAETYAFSLLSSFVKDGHNVLIVTNKGKFHEQALKQHIPVITIPYILDIMGNVRGLIKSVLLFPRMTLFYIQLLKKLKKNQVDVILMSGFTEKLFVTALAPLFALPVVWIEYGVLADVFKRNMGIPKLVYCSVKGIPYKIVVPTKHTLQSLLGDAHVAREQLVVIPCGTSLPKSAVHRMRNGFVIGNISRLTREKGQDVLIKAFPYVLQKLPRATLLLAGSGPDEAYYKTLIEKHKLTDRVVLCGFVKNSADFYNKLAVFVFPSVWKLEGFGLVMVEAMAHKIPVIASNIGPVPFIVTDQKTGILVKTGDEKKLAAAIIDLLKNNKKRAMLANAGYLSVKEKFQLETVSRQIINILYESTVHQ